MECQKGRPPFLDMRSVIQTAVEPLQWLLHVLWKCEAKAPINTSHCCWWAKCTVCCLHLGQFPWKVTESRIQNPSWRKMGQRDKRHEKSKKGRTGVNSSVYICAWFVIFLKLLRCICLFAGYKLFPSQASPCRSQILPEALWRFGRGLDFLQVHLGGKRNRRNWHLLRVALFMLSHPDVPFGVPVSSTAVTVWKQEILTCLGNTFSKDIICFPTFVLRFFSPGLLFHLNVFGILHF